MPTLRTVPDTYASIAEAITAADPGDTIFVRPGTYTSSLTINKPVHIKGDTDDPINNPVIITTGYSSTSTRAGLTLSFSYDASVPQIFLEGVTIKGCYYSNIYVTSNTVSVNVGLTQVIFNRCILEPGTQYGRFVYVPGGYCDIQMLNCQHMFSSLASASSFESDVTDANTKIVIDKSIFGLAPSVLTLTYSQIAVWVNDTVTSATTGYGPAYGAWYMDQFSGLPYKLAGVALGTYVDPELVQIILLRSTNGEIERFGWRVTTPDAAGNWEFKYLSSAHQHYVVLIPPEGHRGEVVGPYTPVQA